VACPALADQLCQSDGLTPLATASGAPIPDLSDGGTIPIGENDRETLSERTWGGGLQATSTARLFGAANTASAGVSAEDAHVNFGSSAEMGAIDPQLVVESSGFFVDTPEGTDFTATPVSLAARTTIFGAFATDTLQLGRLSVTASGRWDEVRVSLHDQLGSALSGDSRFARFNPALGATWRLSDQLTAYAGYAEGSRAPTASEIECSDPAAPCLLPSTLSADPPGLKQVVSRTVEAGLRGSRVLGSGRLEYSAGYYRTEVSDDIYAVATSLSAGYVQNIPGTRREGGELDVRYRGPKLSAFLSYAYVAATFASAFALPSPSNPLADSSGNIAIQPGDTLPGVPRHRLKLGVEDQVTGRLRLGAELQAVSSQFYRGDEANLLAPLPGYAVVGVHGSYAVTSHAVLSLRIENALNARYATFGVLGDPTGAGAPGVPDAGPVNPRFISPAAPLSVTAELTARF
jgi:iron complex outermembrane receptor protein